VSYRVYTNRRTPVREDTSLVTIDERAVRIFFVRALLGLGVSLAGAGVLVGFATVGAIGLLGQRCATLWLAAGGASAGSVVETLDRKECS